MIVFPKTVLLLSHDYQPKSSSIKTNCLLNHSRLSFFDSVEANAAKALAEAEALEQEQAMQEWKGLLSVFEISSH